MLRKMAYLVACGLLLSFSTGCFGAFTATRNIYSLNERMSQDKWIQWGVFLGLNLIPVYAGAALVDAVVVNSVEFWTGENPINLPPDADRTPVRRVPEHSPSAAERQ